MRKKINSVLFFGGSNTQSSAILQLKSLNYNIILVDKNKNCFCKKYCDYFINYSHSDYEKIKKKVNFLKKNKSIKITRFYGVSDLAYRTIANIFDLKEYKKFIYKKKTKILLHKHIDTPRFLPLGYKKEIIKNLKYYKDKLKIFLEKSKSTSFLLKPSYGISSEGIKVFKKKEFYENFNYNYKRLIDKLENNYDYFIEDYINGKIVNIDFVKKKDNFIFFPLIERSSLNFKDNKSLITALQYHSNLKIGKNIYKNISKLFIINFKNYNGPVTLDCIISKKKIFVLEASPHFHNIKFLDFLFNIKAFKDYEKQNNKKSIKIIKRKKYGGYCHFYKENFISKNITKFLIKRNFTLFKDRFQNPGKKLFFNSLKVKKPNLSLLYYIAPSKKKLIEINRYVKKVYKNI